MSSDIADILGGDFNANAVEPARSFDPIPAGWYAVEIDKAMVKDTAAKTGKYLKLELIVLDEPHNGRHLFANIPLANPNPQAVEIGQRELAGLAVACGITALRDSAELLQKQLSVKVKIKTDDGREPDNAVVAYRALEGAAAANPPTKPTTPAAPNPQPKPAAAAPASGKRPWER
jgi:hypothetical protein